MLTSRHAATRLRPLPGPAGAALGLPAGAVASLVTWTFGGDPTTGLVLATLAAVAIGASTSWTGTVVAALQCWACLDGFVLHRFGSLHAGAADLLALGVVAGVALAAHLVTALLIAVLRRRRTSVVLPGYAVALVVGARSRAAGVAEQA